MDKHDQRRKDQLIKRLQAAKEAAEISLLYLTANDRDPEQIANVALACEHVEIALEFLGVKVDECKSISF